MSGLGRGFAVRSAGSLWLGILLASSHAAAARKTVDRSQRTALEITTGMQTQVQGARAADPIASAVVRETREIDLPAGDTELEWLDLPEALRTETVAASASRGADLQTQRFEETLPNAEGLAALVQGRAVRARPRTPDARHATVGSIVSLAGGVVLRVGDELTVLPPSELALVDSSRGVPKRRLVLTLSCAAPTRARVVVSGVLDRVMAHPPHYVATLDHAARQLRLHGSVVVSSSSAAALEGATLFLGDGVFQPNVDPRAPLAVTRTWTSHDGRSSPPISIRGAMRFSSAGAAEMILVDAARVPFVERASATLSNRDELGERPQSGSLRTPVTLTWALASSALGTRLPTGMAWLMDESTSAALGVAGEAMVYQRASDGEPELSARATSLAVESTYLRGTIAGCQRTASWQHTIPAAAFDHGVFAIELPFEEKWLAARVAKTPGVSLEKLASGARRIIVQPLGAGVERKIVVDYKMRTCF